MKFLPSFKCGYTISLQVVFVSVCCTDGLEVHIAGQGSQVVHDTVNTKVVAVHLVVSISIACGRIHLVQRYLTYTVDGVVGIVHFLWHTVLGTLHHHATTEHSAEVGTLDGVHDTAGIG